MIITWDDLSEQAQQGLIEEYCTRTQGVNPVEEPVVFNRDYVRDAAVNGDLVVFFSVSRQSAQLFPKAG